MYPTNMPSIHLPTYTLQTLVLEPFLTLQTKLARHLLYHSCPTDKEFADMKALILAVLLVAAPAYVGLTILDTAKQSAIQYKNKIDNQLSNI